MVTGQIDTCIRPIEMFMTVITYFIRNEIG